MIRLVAAALGALALFALLQVARSLRPYARVLRQPTRSVASLASLARGAAAEIAGTIRARGEPLRAIDGAPAVVSKTKLSYTYDDKAGETYKGAGATTVHAVAAELADATGACAVDLDAVILIGTTAAVTLSAERFAEAHPALFEALGSPKNAVEIVAEQTYVADGAVGMVSGAVEPDAEQAGGGDGYRGSTRGARLVGTVDSPLVLAEGSEAELRRRLARPARLLAAVALGAGAVAGALLGVSHALRG